MKKKGNILYQKLMEKWPDLRTFLKETKVPVSSESARLAIYHGRTIGIPLLMLLCKYLGFNSTEIKKILAEAGDTEYIDLIGAYLTPDEKALLAVYEKINEKQKVLDYMEIIARAEGVTIAKELEYLKRRI